jgi:hypothetical protein
LILGLTAIQSCLKELEEEKETLAKENKSKEERINDFELVSNSKINKNEIRTRIVNRVKEIAKTKIQILIESERIRETYHQLYGFFKQQHPNIAFSNKNNKLEYLINHGYGSELLEILTIKKF